MKWFKHQSDANMNAKLQEIIFDHGIEGYGLYWYCIELVAQNVSSENLTFELKHDARIIARNIGLSANRVEEIMRAFIENDLFSASEGRIQCLKLAKRADDFTAKAIRRSSNKNLINQSVGVSPSESDKVPLEEEVRSKKKEEKKEIKYPDQLNKAAWIEWLSYKSEIKSKYKTERGEMAKVNELIKMSGGCKDIQQRIIHQSIDNEWKGLFELKSLPNLIQQSPAKAPRAFGE